MKFLSRLHAKVGDFWWYSLMIFIACRSGDVIQAFIGLWLVPRYVGQEELGAVIPLQQLCGLFAVPIAIIATVFAKYVNTYATRGEYGKVRCFIRDVLAASTVVFLGCIAAAYLIVPHFYERLRIQAGLLTVLILASGFTGAIAQLFNNALQGLKLFRTMALNNFLSAPVRLVTLLVAMPFRALSGYILGQTTPSTSCATIAAYSLHKTLKAHPLDTSWRKDLPEILRYLWPVALYTAFGTLFGAISATVYRQRLPEVESAAYYLLSKLAEVASYLGLSLIAVILPFASEAHESGKENPRILLKSILGILATTTAISAALSFFCKDLLSVSTIWNIYIPYADIMPWLVAIAGFCTIIGAIITYEIACRRFSTAYFAVGFNLLITAALVSFTGAEFFCGILPDSLIEWMASCKLGTIRNITYYYSATNTVQAICLYLIHLRLTKNLKPSTK